MLRIRRVARRHVFGAVPFHGALYFRAYTAGSGLHDESFHRLTVRCLSAFGKAGCSPEMSRRVKCTVFHRQAFVLSSPAYAAGAPASPDASCRRGTHFFTYGLPVASSRYLAIVRKRPLASVRCSVPPGASAIRATDAAGESSASRLSTAERRGGRRSQPRWLSAAASVARPKK